MEHSAVTVEVNKHINKTSQDKNKKNSRQTININFSQDWHSKILNVPALRD